MDTERTMQFILDNLASVTLRRQAAEARTAQKRTDQRFDRWLDSLNKGVNGHKKPSR